MSSIPPRRCPDEDSCSSSDRPSRVVAVRYRPTRELAIAEEAARDGDLRHAAFHAATALAFDPNHPKSQSVVDDLLEEPLGAWDVLKKWFGDDDPAPLFPKDGWYGWAAVRARAHWKNGRLNDAFEGLLEIATTVPHVDYSSWLLAIATDAQKRRAVLNAEAFVRACSSLMDRYIGLLLLLPTEQAYHEPWAKLGRVLVDTQAECASAPDPVLAAFTAMFLRRAGRLRDAECVAEQALGQLVSQSARPLLLTQRGLAARALGKWDLAAEVFADAFQQTNEWSYLCEIARVRFDQGDFEQALDFFQQAATLSNAVDAELTAALQLCEELLERRAPELLKRFPDQQPTMDDLRRLVSGDGTHLRMTDATTNAMTRYLEQGPEAAAPAAFSSAVSHLESGSVLLALSAAVGKPMDQLPYSYKTRPRPNPFEPLTDDGFPLWTETGALARPALAAPPQEVSDLVASLASSPLASMASLRRQAKRMVSAKLDPMDLVAAMLYPPSRSMTVDVAVHVFHWQLCCALLLSVLKAQEHWEASIRRDTLHSLMFGPPDWTTAAAILALVELALEDPSALEDLRDWLDELVQFAPSQGHCPWAEAVAYAHRRLPGLRPNLLSSLQPWLMASGGTNVVNADGASGRESWC